MIDESDYIIKEYARKSRCGEINRQKMYKFYCDNCNKDRGYLRKSSPALCGSCSSKIKHKPLTLQCNICNFTFKHSNSTTKVCSDTCKAEYYKKYYQDNKDYIQECRQKYINENIEFRLAKNLRNRLYQAIKGDYKSGSAVDDLGCSIEELKKHLESQFQEGMSWNNWTTDGWHIDHIKPLASFDLTDKEQLKKACHYTNLQPMWAKDNLKKGSN